MQQDDFLLNQINILGKILGKVLSNFIGSEDDQAVIEVEQLNKIFKEQFDFNFEELSKLKIEELENFLEKRKIKPENTEILAEIYLQAAKRNKQNEYLITALYLLEYADSKSTIYSEERMRKMNEIRKKSNFGYNDK